MTIEELATKHRDWLTSQKGLADIRVVRRVQRMDGQAITKAQGRAIKAMVKAGHTETAEAPPTDQKGADRYYCERTDTYVSRIRGMSSPIVLSGTDHRQLLRDYSSFDGDPASVNKLARTLAMPRTHVSAYLRLWGITHDVLPFTDEEMAAKTDAELVIDAAQMRRRVVHSKLEAAKWRAVEVDASKWRSFDQMAIRPIMEAIEARADRVRAPRPPVASHPQPFALVIPLQDLHVGRLGQDTRAIVLPALRALIQRALCHGTPEVIYLGVGGDLYNVDNIQGATTNGTPQDNGSLYGAMFVEGADLLADVVEELLDVADVIGVPFLGNHDKAGSIAAATVLRAHFRGEDRFDICLLDPDAPRRYRVYGRNLFCFDHGDGPKVAKMGPIIAEEARHLLSETAFTSLFRGHQHHEVAQSVGGVNFRQTTSPAIDDQWHRDSGYVTSRRGLNAYLVDREGGPFADLYAAQGAA